MASPGSTGLRRLAFALLLPSLTPAALAGCGSSAPPPDLGMPLPLAATVTVDTTTVHQTMVGFGAAVAYYAGSATANPMSAQLMQTLFGDLGIQILRVGNWYNNNADNNGSFMQTAEFVQAVHQAGYSPILLMSSWNPPLALKDNNNLRMGGTLPKDSTGAYEYAAFASWWAESLTAFQAATGGIVPDVISIQNEPDFTTNNEGTCLFDPTEGTHAGYGQALDAVKTAIAGTAGLPMPKLAGPENDSLNKNEVPRYISGITSSGYLDDLDIVAHHLYGGVDAAPNMYDTYMNGVAMAAATAGKPIWQTEYAPSAQNAFLTAWLIQNAVAVEGVSAYLYWDLYWVPPASGLVTVSSTGYTINDDYYAVQHFAKLTGTGWTRVDTSATESVISSSAFLSPDGTKLTLIIVNTDSAEHQVTVSPGAFAGTTSAVYRSSGTTERFAAIGPLDAAGSLDMPSRSVATVTFTP